MPAITCVPHASLSELMRAGSWRSETPHRLRTCCLQVELVELVFNVGGAGVRLTVVLGGVSARRELSRYHSHAKPLFYLPLLTKIDWLCKYLHLQALHFRRRCRIHFILSFCDNH